VNVELDGVGSASERRLESGDGVFGVFPLCSPVADTFHGVCRFADFEHLYIVATRGQPAWPQNRRTPRAE
jgi:hypothetical protein